MIAHARYGEQTYSGVVVFATVSLNKPIKISHLNANLQYTNSTIWEFEIGTTVLQIQFFVRTEGPTLDLSIASVNTRPHCLFYSFLGIICN